MENVNLEKERLDRPGVKAMVWGKAAAEIRSFYNQFRALSVAAEALEQAGGLEKRIEDLQVQEERLVQACREEKGNIVVAAAARVRALQAEEIDLTDKAVTWRAEAKAAKEALDAVNKRLKEQQTALEGVERHIAELKKKFVA